jgi:valyl-tRNA synthetase
MTKELADTEGQIERLAALLSSDFGSKAPPQVVEKERQRLAQFKETAAKLKQQLNS